MARKTRGGSTAADFSASLRVTLAFFVLLDLLLRLYNHGIVWYISDGALAADDSPHGFIVHQWLFYRGSALRQRVVFTLHALVAVGVVVRPQSARLTALLWLLTMSLHGRSPFFTDASDKLVRHALLVAALLPVAPAKWLWHAQHAAVYVGTVANRWRTSAAWRDGTALHYIVHDAIGARPACAAVFARHVPLALQRAATHGTLVLELAAVAALLASVAYDAPRARALGVALLVALHAGIGACMRFPQFSSLCIALCVATYYPWRRRHRSTVQSLFAPRVAALVALLLLAYNALHFASAGGDLGLIDMPDAGNVGQGIMFHQRWVMFAGVSSHAKWWRVSLRAPSDVTYDVQRALLARQWTPASAANDTALDARLPDAPAYLWRDWRMERFMFFLYTKPDFERKLRYVARNDWCRDAHLHGVQTDGARVHAVLYFATIPLPGNTWQEQSRQGAILREQWIDC